MDQICLQTALSTCARRGELTQVQLADKLGVAKQSISNWENDNIMPSVDMLEKNC